MYIDTPVAVPDEPGKVTFREKAGTVYVYYEYERTYKPEKKYNVAKRATIGKLVDPDDRSEMYPNDIFARYFPGELPEQREESRRSGCLRIGTWLVLRKLARELGLPDAVEGILSGAGAGLLMDLAAYSIVTEGNAAQHYPAYAFSHPLFTDGMRMYSDSKVSDFLYEVGDERAPAEFLNRWNEGRDHRQRIWVSYDSTNKSCQAGDIELVEPGHSKDGSGKPVVNCSVAYDRTNSVPLFYEEYPGSIVDVSQLQMMLERARAYGYRRCGFILDRGRFSRANIAYMDACGYQFVMMVKGLSDLVDSLVDEVRGTFETKRACAVTKYRAYGTTLERPLYEGDAKPRWIHVFHSSEREARKRELVEQKVMRMAAALAKHEGQRFRMPKGYSRYFEAYWGEDGETFLFAREKEGAVERELELCGYFAIVTSEKMTAREALELYKSRDASEKLFTGSKSFLGGKALRVHSDESAEGRLFVEFVAMILRNAMHVALDARIEEAGKKANFMTVPAAIAELEKIEVVRQADGVYRLDHAVTATQKEILAAFGMDDKTVKRAARELGAELESIRKGM